MNNFGMGPTIFDVYTRLAQLVGADHITPYGVHYPAVGLTDSLGDYVNAAGAFLHISPLGSYTDSVQQGTRDVQAHIEAVHSVCPDTRFVLSGYSQGAQAVGDALQRMPAADRSLVVSAAFFGDPYFNVKSWSSRASDADHYGVLGVRGEWPEELHGSVFSYCRPHDPVCGFSKRYDVFGATIYVRDFGWFRGFGPHGEYVSSGDTADAARQLARRLHVTTPSTGTVPLDLVFAIDTTGSMSGAIAQVKANVTALTQSIASASTNYRFALVDYKDGPEQGDAYRARVDLPFTTRTADFATAAAALSADGGGDTPESMYSGAMTALNLPWRPGVRKVVIIIGDAPGKDPEPVTGFTLAAVQAKALAVDPAQIYAVATSNDSSTGSFMSALTAATGGQFTTASDTAEFVSTLQSTIVSAGTAPTADAGGPYEATVGHALSLSAGGSRDESEAIINYDWDFNGDGTYDTTTADPSVTYTYATPGTYSVVLRTRTASGLASLATATVTVTSAPTAPSAPQSLAAAASDGSVTLTWSKGSGDKPEWYTITDGSGRLLDRVSAGPDGAAPAGWIDPSLSNGTAFSYRVSAGNIAGESASAGPVIAIPHAANRPPVAAGDAFTVEKNGPLVVPAPGLLANDTDPDAGDVLTASLRTQPRNGRLSLNPDGSFTYTPRAGYVGPDQFAYVAVDNHGAASTPAHVDLTVAPPTTLSKQRFVFVANGHPSTVLVGRLNSGGFNIKVTAGRVDTITGTGVLRLTSTQQATITIDVHRYGPSWKATVVVTLPSGRHTFNGTGQVWRSGALTIATFVAGRQRFAFAISDSRR